MRLCTHARIESGTDMFIEAMRRSLDRHGRFWRLMPGLPPNRFVRAAETRGQALVMRKVVDDGADREPAVHVKGGVALVRREQESVDAPEAPRFDIDEEACPAFPAGDARIALELPPERVAAHDLDGLGRIDGFRRIGAPVHGPAIVAMA